MKNQKKLKLPASMSEEYATETFFDAVKFVKKVAIRVGYAEDVAMRLAIQRIFEALTREWELPGVYADLLALLERYRDETGLEMISSVFEYFSANLNLGQVFTPWEIVNFQVESCLVKLREREEWKDPNHPTEWIEPACGCGRFVVGAHLALEKENRPYVILACDIDADAIRATAVNCHLFKIPAILIHGDFMGGKIETLWHCCDGKISEAPALIPFVRKYLKFDELDG